MSASLQRSRADRRNDPQGSASLRSAGSTSASREALNSKYEARKGGLVLKQVDIFRLKFPGEVNSNPC